MTYTLEKLPGEPALLLKLSSSYDISRDFPRSYAEVKQFLDTTDEPVYYIMDLTEAELDMNFILDGTNRTSGDDHGTFRHPMTRGVIFVSPDPLVAPVANGLSHAVFGNVDAQVFDSLDKAQDYVRQNA